MNFDKDGKENLEEEVQKESEELIENDDEEIQKKGIFEKFKEDLSEGQNNEELDRVLKEKEELNTRLQRLQADFINYKNRVEKEKVSLVNYGVETLVVEILPILDNFERALETENDKEDSFFKGIEMIYEGLLGVLDKNGIKEMDSLEKPFNPDYHHAVGVEDSDEYDKDTVIRILQKGYTMKEKVIRPAMVLVSQ